MNYWLLKSEPSTYSFADLERDKKTNWDGVRNYQARNNLKSMKKGDLAIVYHSGDDKAAVGIAEIIKEFYPDPSAQEGDWVMVDIKPVAKFDSPVTLAEIKKDKTLSGMALIKQSRLSVMPVTSHEFEKIKGLGETL